MRRRQAAVAALVAEQAVRMQTLRIGVVRLRPGPRLLEPVTSLHPWAEPKDRPRRR